MKKDIKIPLESDPWIVYGLLQNLDYEEYLAIAEFVDNSLQSYLDNSEVLKEKGLKGTQVIIESNADYISIRDNAGGISPDKFEHAFRLTKPEALKDNKSLHEFGVGMKTAGLWFGSRLEIETSPIGIDAVYKIVLDLDDLKEQQLREITDYTVKKEDADKHYTHITISKLKKVLSGPHVGEYRQHLRDIYRKYLSSGDLILKSKTKNSSESIKYESEKILKNSYWSNKQGPYIPEIVQRPKDLPEFIWEKEINFDMPSPIDFVQGKAFLSKNFKRASSGIVIFRRGRGVLGTGKDSRYKPTEVFTSQVNETLHATLFIELTLGDQSKVTSSKKLDWSDEKGNSLEEIFLQRLNEAINGNANAFKKLLDEQVDIKDQRYQDTLPLKSMGANFRRQKPINLSQEIKKKQAKTAVDYATNAAKKFEKTAKEIIDNPDLIKNEQSILDPNAKVLEEESVNLVWGRSKWKITVRVEDEDRQDWYTYTKHPTKKEIGVSISMMHPFTKRFLDRNGKVLTSLLRIAAGLALAETLCVETNNKPDQMRMILNSFLKDGLID